MRWTYSPQVILSQVIARLDIAQRVRIPLYLSHSGSLQWQSFKAANQCLQNRLHLQIVLSRSDFDRSSLEVNNDIGCDIVGELARVEVRLDRSISRPIKTHESQTQLTG